MITALLVCRLRQEKAGWGHAKTSIMNKFKLAKINDGDGSLEKQWFIFYYFEDPDTGKMVRFRKWISNRIKTKSGRRDQAHTFIKEINEKLQMGWNPFSDSDKKLTSVTEALDYGLRLKYAKCGKRGQWTYKSAIKKLTDFLEDRKLDKIAIHEFNYHIAQDYVDHMMLEEKLVPRTINNRIEAAKGILTELRKREYLVFNPFDRVDKLKEPEAEITAYTPAELNKIGELLPEWDYNLYVISQLIFYCFIRPAEIVRLRFKDILMDHELIILGGHITKNKKSQVVSMPDQLVKNLKDWNMDYPSDFFLFSTKLKPGSKQIAPTRIAGAWRNFTEQHKLPAKNIYDLKHTGNGMAFDLGMNSRDIQLQNRHSSLEQTQQYLNRFRQVTSDKFKKEFKGY